MKLEVQGREIEVPDGLTQQQIFEVVEFASAQFQAQEQPQQQPQQQEPGLGGRIMGDLEDRERKLQEAKAAQASGQITMPELAARNLGQASGAILDVGGELASAGFETLPEAVQKPLEKTGELIGEGIQFGMRQAGKLPSIGGGTIGERIPQELAENPRLSNVLEDVGLTGMLLAPMKGAKAKVGTGTGKFGEKLIKAGERQIAKTKKDFATDLVSPIQTTKELERAAAKGLLKEEGLLRTKVIQPSAREIRIADVVNQLDIDPKRTFTHNNNVILKGIDDKATQLIKELEATKAIFPKSEVKARINKQLDNLIDDNPFLVGNAELTADRVRNIVNKAVDDNLGTPAGLLKARKQFDAELKRQTRTASGKTIFDSEADRAVNSAISEIRGTVNSFIAEKAPTVQVKKLLGEQELLYGARDIASAKAAREGKNAISRLIDKVPLKGETSKMLAAGGLTAGGALAAKVAPVMAGTGVATVGTYKALRSPQTKKALGQLLKATDKAIQIEKDSVILDQLRLDRAIVLEMLKEEETNNAF